jgi:hypothetical protein
MNEQLIEDVKDLIADLPGVPMTPAVRVANYRRQNGAEKLKPGQRRRLRHKANRTIWRGRR